MYHEEMRDSGKPMWSKLIRRGSCTAEGAGAFTNEALQACLHAASRIDCLWICYSYIYIRGAKDTKLL